MKKYILLLIGLLQITPYANGMIQDNPLSMFAISSIIAEDLILNRRLEDSLQRDGKEHLAKHAFYVNRTAMVLQVALIAAAAHYKIAKKYQILACLGVRTISSIICPHNCTAYAALIAGFIAIRSVAASLGYRVH